MKEGAARYSTPQGGGLARLWPLLGAIFLPNLAVPIAALLHAHPTPLRLGIALAGVAVFVALYLWTTLQNDVSRVVYPAPTVYGTGTWRWVPITLLAGLSVALILGDGPRWLTLLIFTSACAGGRFSLGRAIRTVAALALLNALLGWLTHDTLPDLVSAAFWTGMAGVLTIIINHFRRTNRALRTAREEIARLAVEAERLRFARDLHDLLGHDLARIALQSELAEALVPTAPQQAAAAMREVGSAARIALQEVRAAVVGYRQPSLAGELRGAGEILAAGGIAYQCEGEHISAPPAVEAALAWAVREGVTNVVKHSRARRCTIRTAQDASNVSLEIVDDGTGTAPDAAPWSLSAGGNGLAGLAERAAALGGRCEAGPRPGGGFRLAITLPIEQNGSAEHMPAEQATVDRAVAVDTGVRP